MLLVVLLLLLLLVLLLPLLQLLLLLGAESLFCFCLQLNNSLEITNQRKQISASLFW